MSPSANGVFVPPQAEIIIPIFECQGNLLTELLTITSATGA
jgi:hypothetical protein